jgi:hypothetical protein
MKPTNGIFEDFIGIWDNNVDKNICKELIKYYDWTIENNYNISPDVWNDEKSEGRVDEAIYINSSSPQYPNSLCTLYWNCIQQCLMEYISNYKILVRGSLHSWEFKVHKVKEKQGYHLWHYENPSYEVRDRFIAFMTYLQAPLEGGETEFLHQSKRIDSVAGRTLIWPAGFTHMHRGNPPLKGEKIYITGWFNMSPANPPQYQQNT